MQSASHELAFLGTQRGGAWIKVWIVAIGLLAIGLLCVETEWRALGYRPSVRDSPALWQFWYQHAQTSRPSIALVGSSRMQADLSAEQIRRRLPQHHVAQLARYQGLGAIGILRQLANDERFSGLVICDTLEPFFLKENWNDQRDLYASATGIRVRAEAFVVAAIEDALAVKNASTGLWAALERLVNHKGAPRQDRVRIRWDRSLDLDFTKLAPGETLPAFVTRDVARARARYESAVIPPPEALKETWTEIDQFVRRIQARGGQVVFLRLPSGGERLKLEEEFHPKCTYWSRFRSSISGVCIHFNELPRAVELHCADDSHLDSSGAMSFTDALIDELAKRGLVHPI